MSGNDIGSPMTVVVGLEQRFARTPDGVIWAPGPFRTTLWPRYLEVFDAVRVLARVEERSSVPSGWEPAAGDGVTFAAVPNYLGPWQYARRSREVGAAIRRAVRPGDAVILRVPSQLGSVLAADLVRRRHPFAVEVVGDPYDVFAPGSVRHPLRPWLRRLFVSRLRRECDRAVAASYVTEQALQRRYPSPHYSAGVSDVSLSEGDIRFAPRAADPRQTRFGLVLVGSLAQLYKAPDVLIDAVAALVARGLDLRLTLLGDGRYRPVLEAQAGRRGIGDRVIFRGHLPQPAQVRAELDEADLFVLPSRTEGLPRSVLEAMARALPCIGSTVGGFPELLAAEDLVPPGSATVLAERIQQVLADPHRRQAMSARNLARAGDFREPLLQVRRREFFQYVRQHSAPAMARAGAAGRSRPIF